MQAADQMADAQFCGQGANPLLGMYPTTFTWLDPRKVMFTTSLEF